MSTKPHLILSSLDVDRLEALLSHPSTQAFPGRAALEAEIERADIVEPQEIPDNVVTMISDSPSRALPTGANTETLSVLPSASLG